jgi:hypothetical protein
LPRKPKQQPSKNAAQPALSITLTADGRVFFHQLTPRLLGLAQQLNPADPQFKARADAMTAPRNEGQSHGVNQNSPSAP